LGKLLNLKISDIDSESKKIHIKQSKGKKDRYVMLSENIFPLLRKYYKEYRPKDYLFEGQKGGSIVLKVFSLYLKLLPPKRV
jgi:integrase